MMRKKLVKKQDGGAKSTRVENRANRVMGRAKSNYTKLDNAIKNQDPNVTTSNQDAYINKMENRVARQTERAKALKQRAAELKSMGKKKGGAVKKK